MSLATPLAFGLSQSLSNAVRTNAIRNPRCEGVVAGTPGTPPTFWTQSGTGLSRQIIGAVTVGGIDCIDTRFFGTTSGAQTVVLYFDTEFGALAATTGQSVTASCFVQVVANSSAPGLACDLANREDNASAFLRQTLVSVLGATTLTRIVNPVVLGASTNGVTTGLRLRTESSIAVDITLRTGWPQLERGAQASAPILPPPGAPGASRRRNGGVWA